MGAHPAGPGMPGGPGQGGRAIHARDLDGQVNLRQGAVHASEG